MQENQVSKINVKFMKIIMKIEENEIFLQDDKLDLGPKRKRKTDLGGIYKVWEPKFALSISI